LTKIFKTILISFIVLLILAFALVFIGNFYCTVSDVQQSGEQVAGIDGELLENDDFIARTYGYEDRLVFTYIPRNPDMVADYYADYDIRENNNTIAAGNNRLYEDVSAENPIFFEVPRQELAVYEMDMVIEDPDGNQVHNSSLTIESQNE